MAGSYNASGRRNAGRNIPSNGKRSLADRAAVPEKGNAGRVSASSRNDANRVASPRGAAAHSASRNLQSAPRQAAPRQAGGQTKNPVKNQARMSPAQRNTARTSAKKNNVNLKGQGTNARRNEIRRRKLSPEEIEDMRRRDKLRRFQLKQKRKNRFRALISRALITFAVYLLIMAITCGTFAFSVYSGMGVEYPDYTYTVGNKENDEEAPVVTTYSGSFIYRGGLLYVNLADIASYLGWVTTGDYQSVRYIIPSSDGTDYQELLFNISSDGVTINGTRIRMEGDSFDYEGDFFVPLSFLEKNIRGILITKNEKKHKIQIEHNQAADSTGKLRNEEITLSIKKDVTSEHIDYASVAAYVAEKQAAAAAAASSVTAGTTAGTAGSASSGTAGAVSGTTSAQPGSAVH